MEKLPRELINYICQWTTLKEMSQLALLNRYFYQLIKTNPFYRFCKKSRARCTDVYIYNLSKNYNYFRRFYMCYSKKYEKTLFFQQACKNGNVKIVKWLLKVCPQMDIQMIIDSCFKDVCENGHLKIAQLLLEVWPLIDIRERKDRAFRMACKYGNLKVAKWLLKICPQINIQAKRNHAFKTAFHRNHLQVVLWLVEICPYVLPEIDRFFKWLCSKKCWFPYEDMEQIIKIYPQTDILRNINNIFIYICKKGYIDMVRWLVEICPLINIEENSSHAFRKACKNGNQSTAKWLKEICPGINIREQQDLVFRNACQKGHLEVAVWLTNICPNYIIVQTHPEILYKIKN